MLYYIRGKGKVDLSKDDDYQGKGGEGIIYGKGKYIYKIYHDPNKMIPEAKTQELSRLQPKNILKPLDIILDSQDNIIGFTMDWMKETVAMCEVFTNGYRDDYKITDATTMKLVENYKKTVYDVHKASCLIVDCNETNFLVSLKDFITTYFIDVNGYQTPSFKADALNMSVKDWHTKGFSELTDWFSWAIIVCQIFVGSHPYKGRHPKYGKKELERRMRDNVSIFNTDVSVSPGTRDFSQIPSAYHKWFIDLFEKGKREYPPDLPGEVNVRPIKVQVIQGGDVFDIKLLKEYGEDILKVSTYSGYRIVNTKDAVYLDNIKYDTHGDTDIIFSPKKAVPITVKVENGMLKLKSMQNSYPVNELPIACCEKMIIDNHLFVKTDLGKLTEIVVNDLNQRVIISVGNSWNFLPNSSKAFDGLIFQSALDAAFLMIPLVKGNTSSCIIKKIPELDKYRSILKAKHMMKVCMLLAFDGHKYDKVIIKFDDNYDTYTVKILEDTEYNSLNFTVLDNGIAAFISESDMELFFNMIDKSDTKTIKNSPIDSSMSLFKDGIVLMFAKGKKLYSAAMK